MSSKVKQRLKHVTIEDLAAENDPLDGCRAQADNKVGPTFESLQLQIASRSQLHERRRLNLFAEIEYLHVDRLRTQVYENLRFSIIRTG